MPKRVTPTTKPGMHTYQLMPGDVCPACCETVTGDQCTCGVRLYWVEHEHDDGADYTACDDLCHVPGENESARTVLTVSLDETETDEGFVPVVTLWLDDDEGESTPVGLFWPDDVDTIVNELEEALVEFAPDELRFAGFEGAEP